MDFADPKLVQPKIKNGRFYCPWLTIMDISLFKRIFYYFTTWYKNDNHQEIEDKVLWVSQDRRPKASSELLFTWISHSYLLVQVDSVNIVLDPLISDIIMSRLLFPARVNQNAISIKDLPEIDFVLISHTHHDHFDLPALEELYGRFPKIKFFVPSGASILLDFCKNSAVEFTWWQEFGVNENLKFVFVPSQHGSRRGLFDENKCLWGGWCILGCGGSFYYPGDTGYQDKLFKLIGNTYGPFDVAAIPIGSYAPQSLFKFQHINPYEALLIHKDVGSKFSVGVHWGTFELGYDGIYEARHVLKEEKEKFDLGDSKFECVRIGQTVDKGGKRFFTEEI